MGKGERSMTTLLKEIRHLESIFLKQAKSGVAAHDPQQRRLSARIHLLKMRSPVVHYRGKDLMTAMPHMAIGHCISEDRAQTKGIAKTICDVCPENRNVYHVPIGSVSVTKVDTYIVYNLVTKERYFQKPTYENLEMCLKNLRAKLIEDKVTKLAIPELGCGLDQLQWSRVLPLIKKVLQGVELDIYVYKLSDH